MSACKMLLLCKLQVRPCLSSAALAVLLLPPCHVDAAWFAHTHSAPGFLCDAESHKPFQVLLQPLVKVRQFRTSETWPALRAPHQAPCSSQHQDR